MTLRIAFGADDENECVRAVRDHLAARATVTRPGEDRSWPSMARAVAEAVAGGDADLGVVMCWTGTGTAIAANKVRGVRAAQASDAWTARGARLWNDANVLALSLKRLAPAVALECVEAFLDTSTPDPDELAAIAELRHLDES
ncbi:MAG: RpiB/LacA/LacB family sugar-phosphate isomerase [Actinobacteria bacterium]|nr:RpiB/LacA/LacB family sugar-phosphate isomerase [Actinomycetota bacterium]MBS1900261.1 RpiB/LacA/LacB family sugar-phosphate isomerase [Actinomycetota bacterium]